MGTAITILALIAALLLILIVLVQNPKGGGLASNVGNANQLGGVRQTTDFLEKATWTLAVAILVLSVASSAFNRPVSVSAENGVEEVETETNIPTNTVFDVAPESSSEDNAED